MNKMDKILVKLYVPKIDAEYNVLLPLNKKIYSIIKLLVKAVNEFSGNYYKPKQMPNLYNKLTAECYDINLTINESTIRNGTEIILI